MAENSSIEWTTHTFSPWTGCTKVSPACDNSYAEGWARRSGHVEWGPHGARRRTKTWGNPIKWNKAAPPRNPHAYAPRVFVASLADVFDNHKSIEPAWRCELWDLIRHCDRLDFLLLTKRPQNIRRYLPDNWENGYSNVWLGATVENQEEANRRIPALLSVPAAIHFLSCEPLLDKIDLHHIEVDWWDNPISALDCFDGQGNEPFDHGVDWVITGGESGPRFRPANQDWYRELRDQCLHSNVSFLFKQHEGKNQKIIKTLGRELDGVVHDGYPSHELLYRRRLARLR